MVLQNDRFQVVSKIVPIIKYGCSLRLIEPDDAEFIFRLRTDPKLSRFINHTAGDVKTQVDWIAEYKLREISGNDFYFICIDTKTGSRQGLNRLYNFTNDSFEGGSWLYLPRLDPSKSILSDIIVREIAHEELQAESSIFEVRKDNTIVIKYLKLFNPTLIGENQKSYFFKISRDDFNMHKNRILSPFGY